MRKIIFGFLFFLLLPFISPAQVNKKVDSLKALLKNEMPDTTRAKVYYQLANKLRFNNPTEQKDYALKAIALSRKINFPFGLGSGYNQYAIAMENEGKYDLAIAYYDSSMTIWKQTKHIEEEAKIYLNEANVYQRTADYTTAVELCFHSLKLQEQIKDTFGIAVCQLTLGNIYYSEGNPKEALKNYEEAWRLNKSANTNTEFEGSVLSNIGSMFENMDQHDSALYYFRIAMSTFIKYGMQGSIGATYDNLGTTWKAKGRPDSAIYYYRLGLSMNTKLNHAENVVGALLSIGNFYRDQKNSDSALFYYNRCLTLSKKIKTRDYEKEVYFGMSKVYEDDKNFEQAVYYMHQYNIMNDSLHSEEQDSEVEKMRKGYEIDKKNKELLVMAGEKKLSDEEKKRDKIWYLSGFLFMLIILIVGLVMYRNKQKHTALLERKNEEISQQKEEITSSITYARRIQQSVMPDERILKHSGCEYFILNKPRDIVSGDFYWLYEKEDRTYIAVADCTGHGVPGALVSVIGINLLNKIIEQPGIPTPSEILELLHVMVIHTLNKDADARDTNDGMDIALLCIDKKNKKALFAGASRPLYYSDANGFHLQKGDRYSVAGEKKNTDPPFSECEIPLEGFVNFYLSSDGYADQFGEGTGKKFLSKRFQDLLASVCTLPMEEQCRKIEMEFNSWKGNLEQVDDVLVIGVRV
jgi:serine phosphatase RsbU (regulator of sigma subunit)/tetratricopeptide (TPR) repeat protein